VFTLSPDGVETVLHTFTGPDGAEPFIGFVAEANGNMYGTAEYGGNGACVLGPSGCGVVFKLDPHGNQTVVYSFANSPDGSIATPGLIIDPAGNLYGTTEEGGASGDGTVFKLDATGKETVLHSFSSTDGEFPFSGVIRDKVGNLYGTAWQGGAFSSGAVFKLDTTGKESTLYSFKGGFSDGQGPFGGLTLSPTGNLYGTTTLGGTFGLGMVFEVNPRTGAERVLHNFAGAPDGAEPYAQLVADAAGNLYGTTWTGGAFSDGTVFKLNPTTGKETILHSFNGTDGNLIYGSLVLDGLGNLYGTTLVGGTFNHGTVFKLTP
jgi:uncharacterized repeat protein (TIGR03803 family)